MVSRLILFPLPCTPYQGDSSHMTSSFLKEGTELKASLSSSFLLISTSPLICQRPSLCTQFAPPLPFLTPVPAFFSVSTSLEVEFIYCSGSFSIGKERTCQEDRVHISLVLVFIPRPKTAMLGAWKDEARKKRQRRKREQGQPGVLERNRDSNKYDEKSDELCVPS